MKTRAAAMVMTGVTLFGAAQATADFRVHEWGTFTSLVGSNGRTQPGMFHEDEKLPGFVHKFGETVSAMPVPNPAPSFDSEPCYGKGCFPRRFIEENVVTQKMETPVLYFYSDRNLPGVEVNVRFPRGAVAETYPGPVLTFPRRDSAPVLANGNTTFRLDVLSPYEGHSAVTRIPQVEAGNIYGHARLPDSNIVRVGSEHEKFIFYRGVGTYQPELSIHSVGDGLTLVPQRAIAAAMLVHVDESGDGQMMPLGALRPGLVNQVTAREVATLRNHRQPAKLLREEAMRDALIGSLQGSGLSADEATSMIDTWEHGYLRVPGLRLLYILPQAETDAVLPLTITPRPDALERVFVARIELLTNSEEQSLLQRIFSTGESFQSASLGRFAEPILRRLLEVYEAELFPMQNRLTLLRRLVDEAAVME